MIRIELDSIRKHHNKSEYSQIGRARAPGFEVTGFGENLRILCRKLAEAGHTGEATVYRGKTPVFATPIDIESMAAGTFGRKDQPEHLKAAKS